MPSFNDIANKKVEEIERAPNLPIGYYNFSITKLPETSKSKNEAWEFLRIPCRVVAVVDADVSEYPGNPIGALMSVSYVFDTNDEVAFQNTLFRARQFFEKHVGCVEAGMDLREAMNASVNGQFMGEIRWRQDNRDESGETMQAEIGKTAPVE